ncbi:MAG TPA: carboxymuconolactone decarboxylase family protein [Pirellulales bacterium]|nr:carboxymuconolactone decarboxylase family protein [Pirellulales bacterium]
MTSGLSAVNPAESEGKASALLAGVKAKMGVVPNMMKTMAHSPAVLEGYLAFSGALAKGVLPAVVREQLALVVSQANGCEYCVSAHTLFAGRAGLSPEQISWAREGVSNDPKTQAVLSLALSIMEARGEVSDEQLEDAREAGLSDAEIAEVVGHVALSTLTNYFNNLAHTEVDFPRVAVNV